MGTYLFIFQRWNWVLSWIVFEVLVPTPAKNKKYYVTLPNVPFHTNLSELNDDLHSRLAGELVNSSKWASLLIPDMISSWNSKKYTEFQKSIHVEYTFFEFNGEIIWIPKKYTDGMYTFLNFMVKLFEFQKSIHMGCILFWISWWNYMDSNKFDQFGSSLNQFDLIWSN